MASLPNGISCTNGRYTEGKSGNPFILFHSRKKTGKDTKLGSGLCEVIGESGAAATRPFVVLTISMRAALRRMRKSLPNLE